MEPRVPKVLFITLKVFSFTGGIEKVCLPVKKSVLETYFFFKKAIGKPGVRGALYLLEISVAIKNTVPEV